MLGAIVFLAFVIGLGLRLVRWAQCLPEGPAPTIRTGNGKPVL